jgi:hypothetical protein
MSEHVRERWNVDHDLCFCISQKQLIELCILYSRLGFPFSYQKPTLSSQLFAFVNVS